MKDLNLLSDESDNYIYEPPKEDTKWKTLKKSISAIIARLASTTKKKSQKTPAGTASIKDGTKTHTNQ